jgi:hypothetical protein
MNERLLTTFLNPGASKTFGYQIKPLQEKLTYGNDDRRFDGAVD